MSGEVIDPNIWHHNLNSNIGSGKPEFAVLF
jgi:hypothetical protein